MHCQTCTCYDFIQTFLDTQLTPAEGHTISTTQLYAKFFDWSAANHHPPLSQARFTRNLTQRGIPRAWRSSQGNMIVGYRLAS